MTDKELEKLFQSKLKNRVVEFNPSNWAAMEDMLDGKPSRGGAFYWRSVAAILTFGLLAALAGIWAPAPAGEHSTIVNEQPMPESTAPSSAESTGTAEAPALNPGDRAQPEKAREATIAVENNPAKAAAAKGNVNPLTGRDANQPTANAKPALAGNSTTASAVNRPEQPTGATTALTNGTLTTSQLENEVAIAGNESLLIVSQKDFDFETALVSDLSLLPIAFTDPKLPRGLRAMTGRPTIYLQAGWVLSSSFTDRSPGVGVEVGAGYHRRFSPLLSASAGLNYVQQNNLGIQAKSDSTFYDFGKETIHTEQTTKQLNYLELPLSVNFHLNDKHQFSLTTYTSRLLNVKESHYREHTVMKFEPTVTTSEYQGLPDYYQRWNFGVGASYRFQASRELSLAIAIRKDLSDLSNDGMGIIEGQHQNFSTRVQLRYQLFSL